MKRKPLVILFSVFGVFCLGLRFYQHLVMTDQSTGFIQTQYSDSWVGMEIAVAVMLLAIVLLGRLGDKFPAKPIERSKSLGIASLGMAAASIFLTGQQIVMLSADFAELKSQMMQLAFQQYGGMLAKQLIYILLAVLFTIFMLIYGVNLLNGGTMPRGLCVVPVLFTGYRLAMIFLDYFGLVRTEDITIEIITLLFCMVFWHFFSKYNAQVKFSSSVKWLLGLGLSTALLCFINALPVYYLTISSMLGAAVQVRNLSPNLYFELITGVYILIFLANAYSKTRFENRQPAERIENESVSQTPQN